MGYQTRLHRDVDVDFDADYEPAVLEQLSTMGYRIESDWRPNRVELVAPTGRVDLHPLLLLPHGSARQAAFDGGWHEFPARWFTTGTLDGKPVPCVSAEAQRHFHSGYAPRSIDEQDLSLLDRLP